MIGYEDYNKKLKEILTVFNHQIMIEFFKEIQELSTRFFKSKGTIDRKECQIETQ
jgi:hypothetical protein